MSTRVFLMQSIGKVVKLPNKCPQLVLKPKLFSGLSNFKGFSHLVILWWADQCDTPNQRQVLQVQPPPHLFPDAPRMGVFAVRSPARPNPVMLSVTKIETINFEKGIITVSEIDAFDGTPILDIKPYLPGFDCVIDAKVPPSFAPVSKPLTSMRDFNPVP